MKTRYILEILIEQIARTLPEPEQLQFAFRSKQRALLRNQGAARRGPPAPPDQRFFKPGQSLTLQGTIYRSVPAAVDAATMYAACTHRGLPNSREATGQVRWALAGAACIRERSLQFADLLTTLAR